jgi:hypothetical protein
MMLFLVTEEAVVFCWLYYCLMQANRPRLKDILIP